jgi:hypothetical protein
MSAQDESDDREEREDREASLGRRRMLVASALAGLAVAAEGCDQLSDALRGAAQPCLSPPAQPCLQPTACLNVAYTPEDAATPMPCLSEAPLDSTDAGEVTPQPCLAPPPSRPQACLRVASQPCLSPPRPRVCLSARPPRPHVCLSPDDSVNPFKPTRDEDEDES